MGAPSVRRRDHGLLVVRGGALPLGSGAWAVLHDGFTHRLPHAHRGSLQESTTVPVVRAAASQVHVAIKRCLELCSHNSHAQRQGPRELLLAARTVCGTHQGLLEPGSVLVVPAGWRTGVVMLVLHCDSIDDYFSLAVVTAVSHHP